jgi:hypothetical protein
MIDRGIVVLGIPVPSSSPVFLSIVAIHVAAGLVCAVAGIVAMLSAKRAGRHPFAGSVYYWSLLVVFLSMTALSIIRWPEDNPLLVLGVLSFGAAAVGRAARRRQRPGWLPVHITGMSVSYIVLFTAFYVDNGPHLPLWRALPPLAYWIIPSLVGVPILIRVLKRHPLIVGSRRGPVPTQPIR